jgi:hypothetical protein
MLVHFLALLAEFQIFFIKKNRHKPFEYFRTASIAPIHHLFDSHEHCNPEWCPAKANKRVSKGKYRNIEDNKEMFDWLIENVSKKMEGEKLKALHHPFDTQMNEAMNNAVARRCPKTKCSLAPEACSIE